MQITSKAGRVCTAIFLALCAALLVAATLWDYQIDAAINDSSNAFGKFFAKYGELPAYSSLAFICIVLFNASDFGSTREKLGKLCAGVGYGLGCVLLFVRYSEYWTFLEKDKRTVYAAVAGLIFLALTLPLSARLLPKAAMKKFRPFVIYLLLGVLCTAVSTEVLKQIWGRIRFRDLENAADFTAWYLPQFFTDNQSFPSGHASGAASLLALAALPDLYPQLKKAEPLLFVLGAGYAFLVGFTRMLVGAHYLSDITAGILLAFCFFTLWRRVYLAKKI